MPKCRYTRNIIRMIFRLSCQNKISKIFVAEYLDIAQNFGAKPVAPTMAADLTETPYGDQRTLNDIDFVWSYFTAMW